MMRASRNNQRPYKLDGSAHLFARQCALAARLGLVPWSEAQARHVDRDEDRQRTQVHESAHAVVALLLGVCFSEVSVRSGSAGLRYRDYSMPLDGMTCPRDARVATELAGAVAEQIEFRSCDPTGAWRDLVVATARLDVNLDLGRTLVQSTSRLLEANRALLVGLGAALRERGAMPAAECLRFAQHAGHRLPEPLAFSSPPDERSRVRAGLVEMHRAMDRERFTDEELAARQSR